jgi:hypothetical protein
MKVSTHVSNRVQSILSDLLGSKESNDLGLRINTNEEKARAEQLTVRSNLVRRIFF